MALEAVEIEPLLIDLGSDVRCIGDRSNGAFPSAMGLLDAVSKAIGIAGLRQSWPTLQRHSAERYAFDDCLMGHLNVKPVKADMEIADQKLELLSRFVVREYVSMAVGSGGL
jgi:hypothetical protein